MKDYSSGFVSGCLQGASKLGLSYLNKWLSVDFLPKQQEIGIILEDGAVAIAQRAVMSVHYEDRDYLLIKGFGFGLLGAVKNKIYDGLHGNLLGHFLDGFIFTCIDKCVRSTFYDEKELKIAKFENVVINREVLEMILANNHREKYNDITHTQIKHNPTSDDVFKYHDGQAYSKYHCKSELDFDNDFVDTSI